MSHSSQATGDKLFIFFIIRWDRIIKYLSMKLNKNMKFKGVPWGKLIIYSTYRYNIYLFIKEIITNKNLNISKNILRDKEHFEVLGPYITRARKKSPGERKSHILAVLSTEPVTNTFLSSGFKLRAATSPLCPSRSSSFFPVSVWNCIIFMSPEPRE